jgi:uncharacterized membrane protein
MSNFIVSVITSLIGTIILTLIRWPVAYFSWWYLLHGGGFNLEEPTATGSLAIAVVSVLITVFMTDIVDEREEQKEGEG